MKTYYLSPIAEQDIEEAVTYIAEENPNAAHKFLDSLYDAMNNLADNPELGHLREDLTDQKLSFRRLNGIILLSINLLHRLRLLEC